MCKLGKLNAIEVPVERKTCKHKEVVTSNFDHLKGMFPVIVPKCWCSQGLQQLPGFAFARGAALYQVMVIYGIFEVYVAHISHVDVPREMMAGATLYLLQVGMPSSMKPMKMDFMTTQLQRSSLGPTTCRWRRWIITPRREVG